MRKFKTRLRFTHTPGNYSNPMNVILNDNYNESIGRCDITLENEEVIGNFSLQVDIEDSLFVYYRENVIENFYYAIQLRENQLPDKVALTIAELRR